MLDFVSVLLPRSRQAICRSKPNPPRLCRSRPPQPATNFLSCDGRQSSHPPVTARPSPSLATTSAASPRPPRWLRCELWRAAEAGASSRCGGGHELWCWSQSVEATVEAAVGFTASTTAGASTAGVHRNFTDCNRCRQNGGGGGGDDDAESGGAAIILVNVAMKCW